MGCKKCTVRQGVSEGHHACGQKLWDIWSMTNKTVSGPKDLVKTASFDRGRMTSCK